MVMNLAISSCTVASRPHSFFSSFTIMMSENQSSRKHDSVSDLIVLAGISSKISCCVLFSCFGSQFGPVTEREGREGNAGKTSAASMPFLARLYKVQVELLYSLWRPRYRSRYATFKFCLSPYLSNHASETFQIWSWIPWRVCFHSMNPDLRVHAGGRGWRLKIRTLYRVQVLVSSFA